MSYTQRKGKRPFEYASKASHGEIINDVCVKEFLKDCLLPKSENEIELTKKNQFNLIEPINNPIKHIIAIDGGYSEIFIKEEFPSSTIAFFQIGVLYFEISDLENIKIKPFIDPEDIAKLKNIERLKLPLPTKNITFSGNDCLINSVRKKLFDFFCSEPLKDQYKFIETIKWFIFEEFLEEQNFEINLASCPLCGAHNIKFTSKDINKDFLFLCKNCKKELYLIDIFRLHEAIDNEFGAGGILGYLITLIEQIYLIHLLRIILKIKPLLLKEILFLRDGPLAFFGETAGMHKYMRSLIKYLLEKHDLFLIGLEKSGAFVEHAEQISNKLDVNDVLILDNDYIYKNILPGKADPNNPYGRTTYYGNKLIFKTNEDRIYVATLPTKEILLNPKKDNFKNIDIILSNLKKLKCDMYDNALIPISLVNKLISLSNYPSSIILKKFAKSEIHK